jgi:hypothetical protein
MHILDFYCSEEKREDLKQLLTIAAQSHPDGLPDYFLEKDLWVTEILRLLYDERLLGDYAVAFKGGTALSKCWKTIDRFSEDIDLSIHWADLAEAEDEAAEWEKSIESNSQAKKFRNRQTEKLKTWSSQLEKALNARFCAYKIKGLAAKLVEDSKGEQIEIHFPKVTNSESQYHLDYVLLEFGGRNRGHPTHAHQISCYMAQVPELHEIEFPEAKICAYDPGYILWEKLTALHQFSTMEREPKPHRLARHWYDVDCMLSKNFANPISSHVAMDNVIQMKKNRWPEEGVDYEQGSAGHLQLLPNRKRLENIAKDHQEAIDGRMFYSTKEPDSFENIIDRITKAQHRINLTNSLRMQIQNNHVQWVKSGAWMQAIIRYEGKSYRSEMLLFDNPKLGIKADLERGVKQLIPSWEYP